jgi:putative flippase GtrA
MIKQFARYAALGGIGTVAHYATLFGLVDGLGVAVVLATTAGFVVGATVNYALNRAFTFQSSAGHGAALGKFMLVAAVGALLNAGIMSVLPRYVPLHYLLLQMFTTGLILVWTFFANRFWTFNVPRAEATPRSAP